ncbi:hypothetical protein [Candidatus Enterococcus clewellii]|uniref:Uncharacterized protein n=1 Tax=Candidatus Enterococcus clewellii TaxID=1834193 RepID=A0A242K379_9ENTE|nr:hypothetical protein [Enterococcus sp. 9E7_DIV0242]OTP12665.1 hypothetical protein A5888_003243 [Enterococcus sp. 9E7_DIV0242]
MNKYDEKAKRMQAHLANHPTDYQTVISLFKAESDSIDYERQTKKNLMLREVSKYRKKGETDGK